MHIYIASGSGTGSTPLAAFHKALQKAGIERYNIIQLSSIVPPGATIVQGQMRSFPHGKPGDRLYCDLARADTDYRGGRIFAGMGWAFGVKGGLIVEHTGETRETVSRLISLSLGSVYGADLSDLTRGEHIVFADCAKTHACAVVAAVFRHETWA